MAPLLKGVLDPSGNGSLKEQALNWSLENDLNSNLILNLINKLPETLSGSSTFLLVGIVLLTIVASLFNFLH